MVTGEPGPGHSPCCWLVKRLGTLLWILAPLQEPPEDLDAQSLVRGRTATQSKKQGPWPATQQRRPVLRRHRPPTHLSWSGQVDLVATCTGNIQALWRV